MSDLKSQHHLRRDEIDLLALLERSVSFFKVYKWLFTGATVLGLLLGFLCYYSLPVHYKSRLVLQSTLLSNQNNIQIVTNWNSMLKNDEQAYLSNLFNCPEAVVHKVKRLKADEIQKIFTPNNPNGFILDATVTDVSVWKDLQNGIIQGFDNNGWVRDKLIAKKDRLQALIDRTTAEISRLDSIQQTLENILSGKKTGGSMIIDASGISQQLTELNEKRTAYLEELKFPHAVQVLQEFNQSKKPVGNNLFVWLFLGLAPCLAIAYLYALFHSINQKLKIRSRHRKFVEVEKI
jgi:uncharacterized protein involved in exopolysaccharide biosynthesis